MAVPHPPSASKTVSLHVVRKIAPSWGRNLGDESYKSHTKKVLRRCSEGLRPGWKCESRGKSWILSGRRAAGHAEATLPAGGRARGTPVLGVHAEPGRSSRHRGSGRPTPRPRSPEGFKGLYVKRAWYRISLFLVSKVPEDVTSTKQPCITGMSEQMLFRHLHIIKTSNNPQCPIIPTVMPKFSLGAW